MGSLNTKNDSFQSLNFVVAVNGETYKSAIKSR